MSVASELVDRVHRVGAKFELTPSGFSVRCGLGSMSQKLQSDLRQHKPEIISYLIQQRYEPLYPHPDQREEELRELVRRVDEDGYVLLWCEVLEDYVVYHRNDVDLATIPPSFVPYSEDELYQLFGEDDEQPSPDALRLIHAAKKKGALVRESTRES